MGRIVIEYDEETGLDKVVMTTASGQTLTFEGKGESAFNKMPVLADGGVRVVDVDGEPSYRVGLHELPGTWEFTMVIRDIPSMNWGKADGK